jgi:hypothetical protein
LTTTYGNQITANSFRMAYDGMDTAVRRVLNFNSRRRTASDLPGLRAIGAVNGEGRTNCRPDAKLSNVSNCHELDLAPRQSPGWCRGELKSFQRPTE